MFVDSAILAGIRAHSDDDSPRLVYADWLEENGQAERAEFIRLQCADRDWPRQRELLTTYGPEWTPPLFQKVYGFEYRRGFIEEVTIEARMLLTDGAALFEAEPIRLLRIVGARPSTGPRRSRGLDLSGRPMLDELLQFPQLGRLRALHLTACEIGDEGASLVARCPHLNKLQTLRLGDNKLSDDAVEALTESPHLQSLKSLILSKNKIGDLGATLLARRSRLEKLQSLDLSDNLIGEVGADALANAPSAALQALSHLDLSNQFKGWSGVFELRSRLNSIQPPQQRALIRRFGSHVCVF
jgi:uncharacterized protein (TIGR02996 family)